MEFSFKLFEPHKAKEKAPSEPVVEIRPNGRIILNKLASQLLEENLYCKLGYDEQNNAIGILPMDEKDSNSFNVRRSIKGAYIGAKQFFKSINVLPSEPIKSAPVRSGNFIGIKM